MSKYHYTRAVILEMAVAAENSAQDFYTALAKKFSKHETLFKQLATDEKNHAKIYTDLLKTPEVYSTGLKNKECKQISAYRHWRARGL